MTTTAADLGKWFSEEMARQLRFGGPGYDAGEAELRVELASAKILFVAILRKLGGKIELTPTDLMTRPEDFKIEHDFDYEHNTVTYRLLNKPGGLLMEETK